MAQTSTKRGLLTPRSWNGPVIISFFKIQKPMILHDAQNEPGFDEFPEALLPARLGSYRLSIRGIRSDVDSVKALGQETSLGDGSGVVQLRRFGLRSKLL
jgi:hypothetical protein